MFTSLLSKVPLPERVTDTTEEGVTLWPPLKLIPSTQTHPWFLCDSFTRRDPRSFRRWWPCLRVCTLRRERSTLSGYWWWLLLLRVNVTLYLGQGTSLWPPWRLVCRTKRKHFLRVLILCGRNWGWWGAELENPVLWSSFWQHVYLLAAVTWEIRIFLQLRVCARVKMSQSGWKNHLRLGNMITYAF